MVKVKVKKLNPSATLPSYGHPGDAGLDFCSNEDLVIEAGKRKMIGTGISMELPEGYVALVWDKSGLSSKKGMKVLGGVIDAHYRGEYKITLFNSGEEDFEVKSGDKVAQILIQKVETAELEEVGDLSETLRGDRGFGSTGGSNI